jgi:hypothetical protein
LKQITSNPDFPINNAVWSPNGKLIALCTESEYDTAESKFFPCIYIVDGSCGNMRRLIPNSMNKYSSNCFDPVWSPDSKKISFSRKMGTEEKSNIDIFTINIDGTGESRLTFTETANEKVEAWLKDLNRIAVSSQYYFYILPDGRKFPEKIIKFYDLNGILVQTWDIYNCSLSNLIFNYFEDRYVISQTDYQYNYENRKNMIYNTMILSSLYFSSSAVIRTEDSCIIEPVAFSYDGRLILTNIFNPVDNSYRVRVFSIIDGTKIDKDYALMSTKYKTIKATSWRIITY